MNKSENRIYYLYITISFLFIALTTNYLSLHDIIYVANQTDSISYSEIAKKAPLLPNESNTIIQHAAQRFLIPYIVGSVAHFLNVDFFLIFKLFTIVFIFFYIFLINLLIKKLNFNLKISYYFFQYFF